MSRIWPYNSRSTLQRAGAGFALVGLGVAANLYREPYPLGLFLLLTSGVLFAAVIPLLPQNRGLRYWGLFAAGIFLFTNLRSLADETPISPKVIYVIDLEKGLFGDTIPTFWLHARLPLDSDITFVSLLATFVHWSWFIFPYGTTVVLYAFKRRWFGPYVVQLLGTLYSGLVLYFLVPTVPPWMASIYGYLPPTSRILEIVSRHVLGGVYDVLYDPLGAPNPVAAMPSLHMAGAFALFLFLARRGSKGAFVALAYGGLMAFSLAYLGEHYVIDLLAGVATAAFAFALVEVSRAYLTRHPLLAPERDALLAEEAYAGGGGDG